MLKAALPILLKQAGIRVICLGEYNKSALKALDKIGEEAGTGSELIMVGNVTDIRPYLRGTKLLLLPIGSPHFCRPAIESGFFSKTFIISDHEGLDEFAVNNLNCKKYRNGDVNQFIEIVQSVLNSSRDLNELGQANFKFSLNYQNKNKNALRKLTKLLQ